MAKKSAQKKSTVSAAQKVGLGVGLTAAAVTAAGAYFLYGSKHAAKNRKQVKSWALKAKAEVLEALEKAENITQEEYEAIIEAVGGAYGTMKTASAGEVRDFKNEMKSHWKKIENTGIAKAAKKQAKKAGARVAAVASKTVSKAVTKVSKKPAPKKSPAKKTAKKSTSKKTTKKVAKKK